MSVSLDKNFWLAGQKKLPHHSLASDENDSPTHTPGGSSRACRQCCFPGCRFPAAFHFQSVTSVPLLHGANECPDIYQSWWWISFSTPGTYRQMISLSQLEHPPHICSLSAGSESWMISVSSSFSCFSHDMARKSRLSNNLETTNYFSMIRTFL